MKNDVIPPIWITVSDEKNTLTIIQTDDTIPLDLPILTPPFSVASVKATIVMSEQEHIFKVIPGRRSEETKRVRLSAASEASQRASIQHAVMLTSNDETIRTRAEAIEKKRVCDEELRDLKVKIEDAKARRYTDNVFADRAWYLKTEERIIALKAQSLAFQSTIGRLRDEEKKQNRDRSNTLADHFKKSAHKLLSPEQFAMLEDHAQEAFLGDGENDAD